MALVMLPVGVVLGALLVVNLVQVAGWTVLSVAALAVIPPPFAQMVQLVIGPNLAVSWLSLLVVVLVMLLLVFLGYALASSGITVPLSPAGLLPAGLAERSGRGWLVGLNTGLNLALLTAFMGLAPGGPYVVLVLTTLNFLACIIAVSNNAVFQIILAYANLFLPMSLLINVAGMVIASVNALFAAAGTPVAVFGDWIHANFVMHGGVVQGCVRTAFNVGNYSIAAPAMSRTDPWVDPGTPVWPFCPAGLEPGFAITFPGTVDGALFHEGCHGLNIAAFGSIYHLIGFADEWAVMPWGGGAVRGADAYAELCAESGLRASGRNWIDMWTPGGAATAIGNVNAVSSVAIPSSPGVQEVAPASINQVVAVDSGGNVFIADPARVRSLSAASGALSYVTGSLSAVGGVLGFQPGFSGDGAVANGGAQGPAFAAALDSPGGLAIDAAGNVFIADTGNHRIRRITAATGVITTIAGTGTPGFAGDGAAATAADLDSPSGVAVDAAGNVFIADTANQRIRRLDTFGLIATIAGTGVAGFGGDGGAAVAAQLQDPVAVVVEPAGTILIADAGNQRLRRLDLTTGLITTVAGTGAIGFAGEGGPANAAVFSGLSGVAVDVAGNIFIADSGNHRIRRIEAASGTIDTIAGTGVGAFAGDGGAATAARFFQPSSVAVDAAGNVFVGDSGNARVRRIAAGTGIVTTVVHPQQLRVACERNRGVTLDSTGTADADAYPLPLGRLWQLPVHPIFSAAAVPTPNAATLVFTPDVGGSYSISFDSTDGANGGPDLGALEPFDSLRIDLQALQAVIVVPAGPFSVGTAIVLLDASVLPTAGASGAAAISWSVIAAPTGSTLAGTGGAGSPFSFTPDVAGGDYVIELSVAQDISPLDGGLAVTLTDTTRVTITLP
jgi:sugar lactone lactonase YvrE